MYLADNTWQLCICSRWLETSSGPLQWRTTKRIDPFWSLYLLVSRKNTHMLSLDFWERLQMSFLRNSRTTFIMSYLHSNRTCSGSWHDKPCHLPNESAWSADVILVEDMGWPKPNLPKSYGSWGRKKLDLFRWGVHHSSQCGTSNWSQILLSIFACDVKRLKDEGFSADPAHFSVSDQTSCLKGVSNI